MPLSKPTSTSQASTMKLARRFSHALPLLQQKSAMSHPMDAASSVIRQQNLVEFNATVVNLIGALKKFSQQPTSKHTAKILSLTQEVRNIAAKQAKISASKKLSKKSQSFSSKSPTTHFCETYAALSANDVCKDQRQQAIDQLYTELKNSNRELYDQLRYKIKQATPLLKTLFTDLELSLRSEKDFEIRYPIIATLQENICILVEKTNPQISLESDQSNIKHTSIAITDTIAELTTPKTTPTLRPQYASDDLDLPTRSPKTPSTESIEAPLSNSKSRQKTIGLMAARKPLQAIENFSQNTAKKAPSILIEQTPPPRLTNAVSRTILAA